MSDEDFGKPYAGVSLEKLKAALQETVSGPQTVITWVARRHLEAEIKARESSDGGILER